MKKLRILQVINSLHSGGAEKLVVETSRKFCERGHKVDVLLLKTSDTHLYHTLDNIRGIHILRHKYNYHLYNPLWVLILKQKFRSNKYDVIHVHLFPAFYWSGIAQLISVKKSNLFYTEHNTTNRRRNLIILRLIDKIIYKQYKQIITISDAVDEQLRSHIGNEVKHISKIYNGINLNEIYQAIPYPPENFNLSHNDKLILQVSSFTPQKDQATAIRAMELLDKNYHLFLVGDGPTRTSCESLVNNLSLHDRVHFLGIRSDVPALLKTGTFVLLASHFEGLSLSSVEGMASGKPFLASNVPGLTEVVEGAGCLFEDGKHVNLAQIIKQLSSDQKEYTLVSKRCLERSKKYDINIMIDHLITKYYNNKIL